MNKRERNFDNQESSLENLPLQREAKTDSGTRERNNNHNKIYHEASCFYASLHKTTKYIAKVSCKRQVVQGTIIFKLRCKLLRDIVPCIFVHMYRHFGEFAPPIYGLQGSKYNHLILGLLVPEHGDSNFFRKFSKCFQSKCRPSWNRGSK